MGFIWYIIIGIVAGFLAGKIMRGGGFGLVINLNDYPHVVRLYVLDLKSVL